MGRATKNAGDAKTTGPKPEIDTFDTSIAAQPTSDKLQLRPQKRPERRKAKIRHEKVEKRHVKPNNEDLKEKKSERGPLKRKATPNAIEPTTEPGRVALRQYSKLTGLPPDTPSFAKLASEIDKAHSRALSKALDALTSGQRRKPSDHQYPVAKKGKRGPKPKSLEDLLAIAERPNDELDERGRAEKRRAQYLLAKRRKQLPRSNTNDLDRSE